MTGRPDTPPLVEDPLDRTRFPVDPWRLVETRFETDDLGTTETLFSVGNGYLGMRGNFEESRDSDSHGTYVNGFHETWPIQHAEEAFGFARVGQTMVNAPDPKVIRLYVDDEPLHLSQADLLEYERSLDLRSGVLTRNLLWRTPSGKKVRVKSTRMVSFTQRHLAMMTFEITLLDARAPVTISSQVLNRQDTDENFTPSGVHEPLPRAGNGGNGSSGANGNGIADPRKAGRLNRRVLRSQAYDANEETGRLRLGYRCAGSGMTIAVVTDHRIETSGEHVTQVAAEPDGAKIIYSVPAEAGTTITLTKLVAVHTANQVPARELVDRCERTLDRVQEEGVEHHLAEQKAWLADFWARSDVEVPGHDAVQQALRWNLFSAAQASARAEGYGVPAKGVTGSGYSGHYFWDTEVYLLPFLNYTTPAAARNALRFRWSLLDIARNRARELSQRGALFSWRTINGEEASAYYAAGTAQYHINAAISYALSQYVSATGDIDFLRREAIDVLVLTAQLWADLGFWRTEAGRRTFHIHSVTGPDEYTTVVNDNFYTNVMARFNLRRAAEAVEWLREDEPDAYSQMVRRTGLREDEVEDWRACAKGMFIPFDKHLGIHPQDAHFLERELWDLPNTPLGKRPLLLHHHPLVIYRFQVLKQADVVLALFLQGEEFDSDTVRADFDYYDPLTTGDSTLSAVVQSIIAAEVGYHDLAYRYFLSSLYVDLADLHNNTPDGVHVASTGGVWNAVVAGFGGFRDHGRGVWSLDPRLPAAWRELTYRLTLRGSRIRVTVRRDELELVLEDGVGPVSILVRDKQVNVGPGPAVVVPLADQGPQLVGRPAHPAGVERGDGTVLSAIVPTGD